METLYHSGVFNINRWGLYVFLRLANCYNKQQNAPLWRCGNTSSISSN